MSPEPSIGPLDRVRQALGRHPRAARLALWVSVAATLAGGLLTVGGEMLLGEVALARGGAILCLAAGGLYAGLRLLGVRAAGPHGATARRGAGRR